VPRIGGNTDPATYLRPGPWSGLRPGARRRPGGDLRPGGQAELCHDVLDVGLGRPGGDHQPGGDVPAGQALGAGVDLDERGVLVGEVRAALTELLTALDEPLPPACTGSARARPDLQPQLRGEVRGQASDTARTVAI